MQTNTTLPLINACLNGICFILLIVGFVLIKQRRVTAHRRVMTAAFSVSALFLACYLYYHFNYTSSRFQGVGLIRPLYFAMLISHIILAVVILPFILRMIYLAVKGQYAQHRRLARYVWPVWVYVSATGVLVYLMLYQWFRA